MSLTAAVRVLAVVLALTAYPVAAEAQQPAKSARVAILTAGGPNPFVEAFRQGLKDLGWVERSSCRRCSTSAGS